MYNIYVYIYFSKKISHTQYPRWVPKFKQSEHQVEAEHGITKKKTQQTLIYLYYIIPNFYQEVFVWLYNYNYVLEWEARWFTFSDQIKLVDSYSSQRHTQMYIPSFACRNLSYKSQHSQFFCLPVNTDWLLQRYVCCSVYVFQPICYDQKCSHLPHFDVISSTNKTSSSIYGMARSANGQKLH